MGSKYALMLMYTDVLVQYEYSFQFSRRFCFIEIFYISVDF